MRWLCLQQRIRRPHQACALLLCRWREKRPPAALHAAPEPKQRCHRAAGGRQQRHAHRPERRLQRSGATCCSAEAGCDPSEAQWGTEAGGNVKERCSKGKEDILSTMVHGRGCVKVKPVSLAALFAAEPLRANAVSLVKLAQCWRIAEKSFLSCR